MKKILNIIFGVLLSGSCFAQTLNVNLGQVTYAYPAQTTGEVAVSASDVKIGTKSYSISDITNIKVEAGEVANNTVSVKYNGTSAHVVIAGNLAEIVSAQVKGAHVVLLQEPTATEEITYTVGGTSTDGSLFMDGHLKATFVFDNLNLHNPDSAAVNIQDGKRINVVLKDGTKNVLSDGLRGTDDGTDAHKAALYFQGHSEFEGAGSLTVTGNVKHGISSNEYCEVKSSAGAITIVSAKSDGIHVGQYYEQRGGVVTVNATGDGIDVGLDEDPTALNNGQLNILGGTIAVTVSGETSDAMKCDADFTMSGGNVTLLATGAGGRALNINGGATISGGRIEGVTVGEIYAENDVTLERKPHAMAVDEEITVSGGEVYFASKLNKAFKTDYSFSINGGTLMGIGGKSTSATASTSQQTFKTYQGLSVAGGSTVTQGGVSFKVPAEFVCKIAYVLVSRAGL